MLLASPLNAAILQALADGPKQQQELRRAAGMPAQTTLRAQLKRLEEIEAIEKHRVNRFPGILEFELTKGGRELLAISSILQDWLSKAPDGPLLLGERAAKAATNSLAEAWSTSIVRSLAATPLSLTQLNRIIATVSYPSLERRLSALRLAGLIEASEGSGRGTPYKLATWLRESVAPLAAASRWEHRNPSAHTPPLGRLDIEAIFLLAMPLLRPPDKVSGTCRIAAEIANGSSQRQLAGAVVSVGGGRIESCTTKLAGNPDAWALGSSSAWLAAITEHDVASLELGGDGALARSILDSLHNELFRYARRVI